PRRRRRRSSGSGETPGRPLHGVSTRPDAGRPGAVPGHCRRRAPSRLAALRQVIGPVLELFRQKPIDREVSYWIPVLGDLGPDPRSIAYLKDVLAVGEHNSTLAALQALGRFGPDGVALLTESAKNQEFNAIQRR